jgi:hypothetical protein
MALEAQLAHWPFFLEVNGDPGGGDVAEMVLEDALSQLPVQDPFLLLAVRTGSGDVEVELSRTDDYGVHAEPLYSGTYVHSLGIWTVSADGFLIINTLPILSAGQAGVQTVRHTISLTNTDGAVTATVDINFQGLVEITGPLVVPTTIPQVR